MQKLIIVALTTLCIFGTASLVMADEAVKDETTKSDVAAQKESGKSDSKGKKKSNKKQMKAKRHATKGKTQTQKAEALAQAPLAPAPAVTAPPRLSVYRNAIVNQAAHPSKKPAGQQSREGAAPHKTALGKENLPRAMGTTARP